jgi:hypothetical protein
VPPDAAAWSVAASRESGGRPRQRSAVDLSELTPFLQFVDSYNPNLVFAPRSGAALFHYTDLAGMLGIIGQDDLWLTHSSYSNDSEELTHGERVVRTVVAEGIERWKDDGERVDYLNMVGGFVGPSPNGVYICCFCRSANLLSQWRGYGANGSGVCLQFDPPAFAQIAGPDSPVGGIMRLWKVFYDLAQQSAIVKSVIDFGFIGAGSVTDRAKRTAEAIEFFVPTFKNGDFAEENEWRLIFTPPAECAVVPRLRVNRGMLVPYFSLKDLSAPTPFTLPITGVCIGPSAHRELNVASARVLLANAGRDPNMVIASQTPYRG